MRFLAGAASCALLLAACGGESEEESVVSALAAAIVEDDGFEDFSVAEEDAECTAQAMVDELGTERVVEISFFADDEAQDAELDFDELTNAEIDVLADAMESCITDVDEAIVSAITAGILDEPDPDFPVDEDEARCIAEGLSDALSLSRLIVLGVESEAGGTNPFESLEGSEADAVGDAFLACVDVRGLILGQIAAEGVPKDVLACFDENISDEEIGELFRAALAGEDVDQASEQLFLEALEDCG